MIFENIFEMIIAAILAFVIVIGIVVSILGIIIIFMMFRPFSELLTVIILLSIVYIKLQDC